MASLEQKITSFIETNFPDIDYSVLGNNENSNTHKTALDYEYFVNSIEYYNFQKEINTESIKQISTGDLRGIDGCFVILNNQFVFVPELDDSDFYNEWKNGFDELVQNSPKIDAQFVFIQSKSSKTELDKFGGFCAAVYDVFGKDENDLSNKPKVKTLKYIFSKICEKDHVLNLVLNLCAIQKDSRTLSRLVNLPEWETAINREKKDLKSTIFNNVEIELKSGQDFQEKLEAILAPNQRVFPIGNLKERFIEITNDKATCYIGYLNLLEIRNLLQDSDGGLDDVFFDNIRYFEGFGSSDSINSKIYSSLSSNKDIFHLLHNGITVTAHSKHYNPDNGNLEIKAFSIINGCQTSNIVWEWIVNENKSDREIEKIRIPVKIIISGNNDLRALITETANSQNEVKSIQLIAVSEEAKSLQSLFDSEIRIGEKLYYERLSNQFPEIGPSYKLLTTDIFRGFYSSYGKSPHKLTVGYGGFEKEMLKQKDFLGTKSNGQSKHDIRAYHLSAVLFNYLERFIRSKYPSLISLRHHFLLLLFISLDKDFITKSESLKRKIPNEFYAVVLAFIKNKRDFESRVDSICKIAIEKMNYFIEIKNGKPKVILKSYYTEEGTEKMVRTFVDNYLRD
jgi:hypothetical protein